MFFYPIPDIKDGILQIYIWKPKDFPKYHHQEDDPAKRQTVSIQLDNPG
jgi:hypothetical protein